MGRSTLAVQISLFAAVALCVVPVTGVAGQEAEVRAAADQILVGMRTADSQMVKDVFSTEARFAVINARNGPATIRG